MKTIQKILSLVLISLLLFSLVACERGGEGDEDKPEATVEYVSKVLKAASPTKAVTKSTYVIGELTLSGTATLLVNRNGSIMDAKYSYRMEILNPAGTTDINGNPLMIGVVEDTKYSKGDMVASFHPETGDATYSVYDVANKLNHMALPSSAEVAMAEDGTVTLTAKVAVADIQSTFGVAINATGDIQYKVVVKGGKLVQFSAAYQTALGQMSVQTDYSYDKVSFDVSAPAEN